MQPDEELVRRYPQISFRKTWKLSANSLRVLGKCEGIVNVICRMPMLPTYRAKLLVVSLNKGAQATTAIEGNTLSDMEVRSVAQGQELAPSKAYQAQEVRNILDVMNRLMTDAENGLGGGLITAELIKQLHREIGRELGDHFDAIPGQFRTDERSVGHYKTPRASDVPRLVEQLCEWLTGQFGYQSGRQSFADAVVQAIVTHVYLEWIHPFGDGNGRTGRLLEFYVLLRAGNPDIASHILSNFYNVTRPEYYRQLELAGRNRDVTAFIEYAIQGYHDGLDETLTQLEANFREVSWRSFVHDTFSDVRFRKRSVFKRRRRLALSLPVDRWTPASRISTLTVDIARDYATLSQRTVDRDIAELRALQLARVNDAGDVRANDDVLNPHFARRRKTAAAAVASGGEA